MCVHVREKEREREKDNVTSVNDMKLQLEWYDRLWLGVNQLGTWNRSNIYIVFIQTKYNVQYTWNTYNIHTQGRTLTIIMTLVYIKRHNWYHDLSRHDGTHYWCTVIITGTGKQWYMQFHSVQCLVNVVTNIYIIPLYMHNKFGIKWSSTFKKKTVNKTN